MKINKYKSLGQIVQRSDFTNLLTELQNIENDKVFLNNLLDRSNGPCQLDSLLFHIPQYSLNEERQLNKDVLKAVDKIISLGADPNAIFKSGMTAFMQACQYSNKEYVDNYQKIANVNCELGDGRGARPLYYAMMGENTEVLDYLVLEQGVNINHKMILLEGKTVYHCACMEMKEVSIFKLMELNARPDIYDDVENLPCQMIPTFDDELYDESEKDQVFYDKCDRVFEILSLHLKEFKKNKKLKLNNK